MSASAPTNGLPRPTDRRRATAAIVTLLVIFSSIVTSGTASAHTGFESSTPSDGAATDAPVELVTIVFTGEATPVGDEFVALTPDGVLQQPSNVETLDNKLFSIRFDPPLAGGQVGIRWNVQAADAHPIEGAFSFTVNAPAPTTTPPPTAPPTTAAVAAEPAETIAPSDTETQATELAADDATAAVPSDSDGGAGPPAEPTAETANPAVASTQSLDDFLEVDNSTPGQSTATVGRLVGFLGIALGIGALAFAATALRGQRDEIRRVLAGIRILGLVIAVGALIEYVGVARIGAQSLLSNWSAAPGFATALRIIGGIGLTVGVAGTISRGRVQTAMRRPSVVRSLSAAVIDQETPTSNRTAEVSPIVRWTPDVRSWPAFAGIAAILASFWFDGHTVSKGFRPLHAVVNSVHVAAGSVWVGGVVVMAAIVWSRHRSGQPMRMVELVVRFSKIATIALTAVVIAGAVMAFLVLDTFGELTGTTWGKMLLLKTGAVGLAMIGGAYNHFRLLPALEADPESPDVLAELRNTVTAEAIMLVFVVTVTAWLVSAAS